ncbi:MAG: hypothetical protein K2N35_09285 [Muribaculaceae bacterium]|nr:hypothetical protein [Muribaculaceae bacterium]
MKYFLKLFLIAVAMVTAIPSFAVTDKEMEQARAIAAKHYLRYANNGSDYLDKLNPSSVSELSKSLKSKEQENIKSFNAVAVPKDYASWDKKKLVEYWSSTFFKSPGLKDDGKKCLSVLARNLNKLTVAAPAATPAAAKPAEASAQSNTATPTPSNSTTPAASATPSKPSAPTASPAPATTAAPAAAANSKETAGQAVADAEAEVAQAVVQAEADAGLADEQPKKSSNTGWYIGILVVLVGVVIWLVVYASKSMKETGATLADHKAGEKEIREAKKAAKEEQNKMREQYANSLTSKNDEIKQLKAHNESLEKAVDTAQREADALRRELDAAKRELAALRQGQSERQNTTESEAPRQARAPQRAVVEPSVVPASQKAQVSPARPGGLPPVVFLGYVNQRGLFVKASRTLNMESSVYRMDIPDGHHGLFRVVNDPDILDRLLDNTAQWLEGGCVIENPEDADIAVEIVTLQPGEALFSDNTCRVTKKARIKFV